MGYRLVTRRAFKMPPGMDWRRTGSEPGDLLHSIYLDGVLIAYMGPCGRALGHRGAWDIYRPDLSSVYCAGNHTTAAEIALWIAGRRGAP